MIWQNINLTSFLDTMMCQNINQTPVHVNAEHKEGQQMTRALDTGTTWVLWPKPVLCDSDDHTILATQLSPLQTTL